MPRRYGELVVDAVRAAQQEEIELTTARRRERLATGLRTRVIAVSG